MFFFLLGLRFPHHLTTCESSLEPKIAQKERPRHKALYTLFIDVAKYKVWNILEISHSSRVFVKLTFASLCKDMYVSAKRR